MPKPTPPPAPVSKVLTPQQKAAVIIGLLGKEAAKPVFDHLEEEDLRVFGQTMAALGDVNSETVSATVEEFLSAVNANQTSLHGDLDQALELLGDHISEAALARLRFELDNSNADSVWQKLSEVDPVILAGRLEQEHAQVIAIVLAKLSAEHSAAILNVVDAQIGREIVSALNNTANPNASVVDDIGRTLAEVFFLQETAQGVSRNPAGQISAIFDFVSGATRENLMEHLASVDRDFADEVRRNMFTFADIAARIDNRDVAKIARAVDQGTLLKALAGAENSAPNVVSKILDNISSRLADQLKEAMTELGAVKLVEAEAAQTEIIKAIRELELAGELKLIVEGDVGN